MLFTSESVSEGHPDKICDQISDAILDNLLQKDPDARVAIECAIKSGLVYIFGEISTEAWANTERIARDVIRQIGFDRDEFDFNADTCGVISSISEQSPEIAQGINGHKGENQGAGDQGIMFGYACRETPELMPLAITMAHKLTRGLADLRHNKIVDFLRPDGKSQITVQYNGDGTVKRVHTVVVSTQHSPNVSLKELKSELQEKLLKPQIGNLLDDKTIFHCNPTGSFVHGGPAVDAGLTGRKIIVDTYGGSCPHGGGAFSGKDPSKVDRSAAYAARYIAKNLVAANLADKCQVQLSYAIGIAEPVSIMVDTFDTSSLSAEKLEKIVYKHFPLKPAEIIRKLDLKKPIYLKTACGGHFGRSQFSWEKLDKVELLKSKYL